MRIAVALCVLCVAAGCSATQATRARRAQNVEALLARHAENPAPALEPGRPLLQDAGDWASYQLTRPDGTRALQIVQLAAFDTCGTWLSVVPVPVEDERPYYLCAAKEGSRYDVRRVYEVPYDAAPVEKHYGSDKAVRDAWGAIVARALVADTAQRGTSHHGVRFELLDRGAAPADGGGTDEPSSITQMLWHASDLETRSRAVPGRLSVGLGWSWGATTRHAGEPSQTTTGVMFDLAVRIRETLDLAFSVRDLSTASDPDLALGASETSLVLLGARWAPWRTEVVPSGPDALSWATSLRTGVGVATFTRDSGDRMHTHRGIGVETALGLRVPSRRRELAFSFELFHAMAVVGDAGVRHVVGGRMMVELYKSR